METQKEFKATSSENQLRIDIRKLKKIAAGITQTDVADKTIDSADQVKGENAKGIVQVNGVKLRQVKADRVAKAGEDDGDDRIKLDKDAERTQSLSAGAAKDPQPDRVMMEEEQETDLVADRGLDSIAALAAQARSVLKEAYASVERRMDER